MRKYRYLAVAAASAAVLALPASAAFAAPTTAKPVLTINSTSGAAVAKGAKLTASLAKGTHVTFAIGKYTATCTKSSYSSKVTANPTSKGTATLSVTSESISKCTLSPAPLPGVTLASLTAVDLPANSTVTAKDGVTVSATSKSKPIGFSAKIDDSGKLLAVCVFTTTSVSGKGSNKGNTVSFSKQKFTLNATLTNAKYLSTCEFAGTTSLFSATYGPVTDTSVKGSPKVFVS